MEPLTAADLAAAWSELNTAATADALLSLGAVSIGTPHFSRAEFLRLDALLGGRTLDGGVPLYVSTGRDVLAAVEGDGIAERLRQAGVRLVTDTCTYITPILDARPGQTVMTNSAKWAWYAPGNLGVQVVYGSLADCVESAVLGRVVRERPSYLDG